MHFHIKKVSKKEIFFCQVHVNPHLLGKGQIYCIEYSLWFIYIFKSFYIIWFAKPKKKSHAWDTDDNWTVGKTFRRIPLLGHFGTSVLC